MFEAGTLASAKGGEGLRLFSRGADGLISGQGAIKPLLMAPQQVLTAQMALTTIALTAAIKDVQAAVERVEDKVDLLRDLIDSQRVGEILGSNRALARRADKVGYGGQISDTDWQAIDGTGVEVEQQIETLRSFIRKRLKSAETKGMQISGRRDAIDDAKELSEALALLVVAQDSLFTYQELRIQRIRATEPHQLESALEEANELSNSIEAKTRISSVVCIESWGSGHRFEHWRSTGSSRRGSSSGPLMTLTTCSPSSQTTGRCPTKRCPSRRFPESATPWRRCEVAAARPSATGRRAVGRFAQRVGDRLAKEDDADSPEAIRRNRSDQSQSRADRRS